MANKLTKKKLEELILEVLSESTQQYDIYITTVPMDVTADQLKALDQDGYDGKSQHNYSFPQKGSQIQDFLTKIEAILKKYNIPVLSFGGLPPKDTALAQFKIGGYLTVKKKFTSEDDYKKFKTEAKDLLLKERPEASVDDFRVKIYDSNTEKPIPDSTAYTSTPAKYDATTLDNLLAQVPASKNATELKTAKDNLTNYYTQFQADIDKDTTRKTKYDNALVAKFKFDKTKFDKLYQDLVDASKLTDQTVVDNAKKAITDYYNSTGTKDSASDTKFANVTNFKAAFDLTAYNAAKAVLSAEIANNNDDAKISKALADLKTYYNTNKAEVDKADSNAATEIADLETQATDTIDALKNRWKQDPLGMVDHDFLKSSATNTYTDPTRDKILQALKTALKNAGVTDTQITNIANLSEIKSNLHENPQTFDFTDIEKLYDDTLANPDGKLGGTKRIGLVQKINKALKNYISQTKNREHATKLAKAKETFNDIITKSKDFIPQKDNEFAPSSRMPMTTTVVGEPATGKTDLRSPVDPVVFQAFEVFFKGKTDFKVKLEYLEDFSNAIIKAAGGDYTDINNTSKFPPEVVICGGHIMNMISQSTREFDAAGGGYFAEAFLAFIAGGKKTGQSGGAGDFTDGTNNYSAKWGQSSTSQAVSNFAAAAGTRITYVSAEKLDVTGASLTGETSQTVKIAKVQLRLFDVYIVSPPSLYAGGSKKIKTTGKVRVVSYGAGNSGGTVLLAPKERRAGKFVKSVGAPSYGSYDFAGTVPSGTASVTLTFALAQQEFYDSMFSRAISGSNQELVKSVARLNAKAQKLEEQGQSYTVSGDFSDAVAMANNYINLKQDIMDIYKLKSSSATSADIGLTENKNKSLKDLDKLIERVILESMNKK